MLTDELVFWGLTALAVVSFIGAVVFLILDIRDCKKKKKAAISEDIVIEKKPEKEKKKKKDKKKVETPIETSLESPEVDDVREDEEKKTFTESFDSDRIDNLLGKINK